jgi:CBS domain-containing protein
MQPDVLTLRPEDSVESAVGLLEEYHVGGAPVLDDSGRILGVFSASDVARRDHVQEGGMGSAALRGAMPLLDDEAEGEGLEEDLLEREGYSPEVAGGLRVQDWMTHGAVSVGPDATLAELCRAMLAESIHRVFVVEDGRLRGVVSTFDLVRLLAGPAS